MALETITVPGHGPHYITGRQRLTDESERLTLVPCHGTGVYRAKVSASGDVVSYEEVRGRVKEGRTERPRNEPSTQGGNP